MSDMPDRFALNGLDYLLTRSRAIQDEQTLNHTSAGETEYIENIEAADQHALNVSEAAIQSGTDVARMLVYAISALARDRADPDKAIAALVTVLRALKRGGVDVDGLAADHHVPGWLPSS